MTIRKWQMMPNPNRSKNMDNEMKYMAITDIKSTDKENRIVEFVLTKEVIDYDNEIVKVDGMDIKAIKKNKSFLWSHKHGDPPVGKVIGIKKEGKQIVGKAQMTSEEEYPFGYTIYKLIDGGYINNVSAGFLPDYSTTEYKEIKGKQVRVINDSKLLEVSAVNVGANPGTSVNTKSFLSGINKAVEDGILTDTECKDILDMYTTKSEDDDLWESFIKQDDIVPLDNSASVKGSRIKKEDEKVVGDRVQKVINDNEILIKELRETVDDLTQRITYLEMIKDEEIDDDSYLSEMFKGFEATGVPAGTADGDHIKDDDNFDEYLSKKMEEEK